MRDEGYQRISTLRVSSAQGLVPTTSYYRSFMALRIPLRRYVVLEDHLVTWRNGPNIPSIRLRIMHAPVFLVGNQSMWRPHSRAEQKRSDGHAARDRIWPLG